MLKASFLAQGKLKGVNDANIAGKQARADGCRRCTSIRQLPSAFSEIPNNRLFRYFCFKASYTPAVQEPCFSKLSSHVLSMCATNKIFNYSQQVCRMPR